MMQHLTERVTAARASLQANPARAVYILICLAAALGLLYVLLTDWTARDLWDAVSGAPLDDLPDAPDDPAEPEPEAE